MRLVPLMAGLEKAGDSSNAEAVAAGIAMEITAGLLYRTRGAEGEAPMVAGGEDLGARCRAALLVLAARVRSAMVGIWTGAGEGARAAARVPPSCLPPPPPPLPPFSLALSRSF